MASPRFVEVPVIAVLGSKKDASLSEDPSPSRKKPCKLLFGKALKPDLVFPPGGGSLRITSRKEKERLEKKQRRSLWHQ